jgi:UDP-N-acetylglucosamine--N-acetylmuramyl-(pentapeptide) pyrophosphoryl-undecaprenol N-acetylglucosamine transferase
MVRPLFPVLVANGVRVVHLTGSNDPEAGQSPLAGVVERPFSEEIPALLQQADLAISRSGAGSLSELAICGTPAILVPYPAAADQHQEANAAAAAAVGAAVIVHQHSPDAPGLGRTLWRLLGPRLRGASPPGDPLVAMATGMQQLANTKADQELAQLLQQLVPQGSAR